jgi:hypothetical protein
VSDTSEVLEAADGSVTIDDGGVLSFTVAAGDLVVLELTANTDNTTPGGADVRDHLFQTDAAGSLTIGAGEVEGTVWA